MGSISGQGTKVLLAMLGGQKLKAKQTEKTIRRPPCLWLSHPGFPRQEMPSSPRQEVILGPTVSPLGPCLGGAARSAGCRGPGAPCTAAVVGLMSPWASHIAASQRHSASCLRGLKHQSRKLHNGSGRPPPRWLMGGAVRCCGLAFDLRVSSCALPMRPQRVCVCACTHVSVCVHACE